MRILLRLSIYLRARRIRAIKLLRLTRLTSEALSKNPTWRIIHSPDDIDQMSYLFALTSLKLNRVRANKAKGLLAVRSLYSKGQITESELLRVEDAIDLAYRQKVEYVLL